MVRLATNNSRAIPARSEAGMSLVEIAIGVGLVGLIAAAGIATLMVLNKNAVSTRLMTNAKEIVRRNIERASGVPFASVSPPSILATTSSSGVPWDEAGGSGPVTIYTTRDGTGPSVQGTLTRTVTAEPNTPNADIRRVNFRISYSLFGRQMSYELTTLRAADK